MHLGWHITGDDRAYRLRHGVIMAAPYGFVVLGAILAAKYGFYDVKSAILAISFFLLLWIFVFAGNELFSYPARSYELTEYGVTITKGGKSQNYRWDEFGCFYVLGLRHLEDPIKRYLQNFDCTTIYLRKKKRMFGMKTFVVLYVPKPYLDETRYNLGVWVGEKKPNAFTDFGLTRFEFR